MDIRTTSTTLTQTHREANTVVSPPTTIVTATAVVVNPLAGQGLVQDLSVLEQLGNEVATLLVELAETSCVTVGLVVRPTRASKFVSNASLLQPIES